MLREAGCGGMALQWSQKGFAGFDSVAARELGFERPTRRAEC